MAGHGFLHVDIVINDLEESKSILVDVDTAEFANFIGCISNKANEVTAKVCMNLRSVDVGKVVGLVQRTGEVASLGVEFGVVGGRSTHAVNEVDIKEIRICQTLLPFLNK